MFSIMTAFLALSILSMITVLAATALFEAFISSASDEVDR
jgi:hypothetical protein